MKLSPIYHAGIRNSARYPRHADRLLQVMDGLGNPPAQLIDIRKFSNPIWPEWMSYELCRLFGDRYTINIHWANYQYWHSAILLPEFSQGLRQFEEQVAEHPGPRVLLCSCRSVSNCHRLIVANELQKRGYDVAPLDWSLPRISAGKETTHDDLALF